MLLEPFRVTARLEGGLAHATPWGVSLDGLLASEMHHARKAALLEEGGEHTPLLEQRDPEDLPLPLAICRAGPDWHWAATCSWPIDGHELLPEVQHWTSRVDHRAMTDVVDTSLQQVVADERGRWRAHMMPLLITTTSAVTWTGVGDTTAIRQLLEQLVAIGKKRAHGHGRVLAWQVDPEPDLDPWVAGHLHPDHTLGRPVPQACLDQASTDVVDVDQVVAGRTGIRPPLPHPSRQRMLLLPHR